MQIVVLRWVMRARTSSCRNVIAGLVALALGPVAVQSQAVAQVAGTSAPASSAGAAASGTPPVAASSQLAAAPATALPSGAAPEQVVWLTSGAIIRGQVVELVPGVRVTLQLATGEIRTVPWSEIARSSFVTPSAPPPAPAAPPASVAPAAGTPSSAPPAGVLVDLIGDRPGLWIESRRRFTDDPWTLACRVPCEHPIEVANKSLRINGADIRPSNPFFIDGHGGREVLAVKTGAAQTHAWGQRSLVGGIALGLAGGAAYGLGKVQDSDPAVVGGLVGMIAGGALLALALPLLGASSTHVRNSKGDRIGRTDATLVW